MNIWNKLFWILYTWSLYVFSVGITIHHIGPNKIKTWKPRSNSRSECPLGFNVSTAITEISKYVLEHVCTFSNVYKHYPFSRMQCICVCCCVSCLYTLWTHHFIKNKKIKKPVKMYIKIREGRTEWYIGYIGEEGQEYCKFKGMV